MTIIGSSYRGLRQGQDPEIWRYVPIVVVVVVVEHEEDTIPSLPPALALLALLLLLPFERKFKTESHLNFCLFVHTVSCLYF
jgi:hypothetical protein